VLPGYEILEELGRGGMGVVYKARQIQLDRLVALKMLLAGGSAGQADLTRFKTEAEAIARLNHPNVVQVYEVGEHGGVPFFSLEFCPGGSLDRNLAGTPLEPKVAAKLMQSLAEAMRVAHQANVIHRDLKPANVLLSTDGTPKITDFGLARKLDEAGHTRTGQVMGTPSYMAPEQAEGKKGVGPAADIYALGAILYECLVGRPPFKAATSLDTLLKVLSEQPVRPRALNGRVPLDLEAVCLRCLEKDPAGRYASAADLAEDLRRFLAGEVVKARPTGLLERGWRWCKRQPGQRAGVVGAALAVVGIYLAATQPAKGLLLALLGLSLAFGVRLVGLLAECLTRPPELPGSPDGVQAEADQQKRLEELHRRLFGP
jgi:serine/threonine protein kinase